jgi:hypothetical protein
LAVHPDKTFIGWVEPGFDFLGYDITPQGLRAGLGAPPRRRDTYAER